MAPRKSTSKASRPSSRPSQPSQPSQPTASSSKITLDLIQPADLPISLTPEYTPQHQDQTSLTEPQREQLVHEVRHRRTIGVLS